jgi:ribosomal protein S18 acetylase RimI-like enzyme
MFCFMALSYSVAILDASVLYIGFVLPNSALKRPKTMPSQPELPAIVRPVRLSDADDLNRLCWPDRPSDSVAELLHRTQRLAQTKRGLGVVAVTSNIPCGFGLLSLWPRGAEISDLIVNANYRSRGLGSLIIQYLTSVAKSLHVQTLEIGVAMSNPRALALYRRLEFIDGRTIMLNLGNGPEPVLYLYKMLD